MIITCPSCSARFAVKTEAIGTTGRKVRCAKCKYDWFQTPTQESMAAAASIPPEPVAPEPIPEGSNLPAEVIAATTPMYIKVAFAFSFIFFLIALSIVSSSKILPHMGWYYNAMGIYDDSGIALYNVSVEKVGEEPKKDLLVKGRIVNESKADKIIPNLRLTLLVDGHKEVRKVTLDPHSTTLAPGDGIDFENKITSADNVSSVVMDIGNSVNLASR